MPDDDRLDGDEEDEIAVTEDGRLDPEAEAKFETKVRVHLALLKPKGPPPKTRGDCLAGGSNEARPCRWVSCKWYLPRMSWDAKVTCALDVADLGGSTLEEVGGFLGITRERVRQIEERTLRKLKVTDRGMLSRDSLQDLSEVVVAPKGWNW
jgi:Sigma-70, region 4